MKFARPILRFSLRAILLVIATASCFLGWSFWDSEHSIVAAIEREGGSVYFRYQRPSVAYTFNVTGVVDPDLMHFGLLTITASPRLEIPFPTWREVLRGDHSNRRVAAVDLPLEKMTPEMVDRLKLLGGLRTIIVRVDEFLEGDSREAARLSELDDEFSGRLQPSRLLPRT